MMYENFYRYLYLIRRVEEKIGKIYPTDKIKSPIHLSIGQEAVSVGACLALKTHDVVFGTYRGHALYLAKGGNLKKMIAELYGKATGCAKGKGGSMHLVDRKAGVMGQSAVVGTTIPQAVGFAFAQKYLKVKKVTVSFFGDGAVEEGAFHESMNFAALKKLPIIFICENNLYAIHSSQKTRQGFKSIYEFARSYEIPSMRIENNDVLKIFKSVKKVADVIRRKGAGPFFFECMTYRFKEHVGPGEDYQAGYRSMKEAEKWLKNDQLKRIARLLNIKRRQQIEREVEKELTEAFEFAENSPFPNKEDLYKDVFLEN